MDTAVETKKFNFKTDAKFLINYMLSILMYSIFIILILIGIIMIAYFIDVKKRGNSTEWKAPLYGAYVIMSSSMEKTIMTYDAIIVRRFEDSKIDVGDVITYKSEDPYFYGLMITHRVVDIKEENGEKVYVTQGDNNQTPDRLKINPKQVYGKVVMVVPKIGYIQSFLATSYGWIIAVVTPCLAIISYDIFKLGKKMVKNNRYVKRRREQA